MLYHGGSTRVSYERTGGLQNTNWSEFCDPESQNGLRLRSRASAEAVPALFVDHIDAAATRENTGSRCASVCGNGAAVSGG